MPSKLRVVSIPATAGNSSSTTANPPDGHIYRVLGWHISLVCDATVANRSIRFAILKSPGGETIMSDYRTAAITASQTKTFAASSQTSVTAGMVAFADYNVELGDLVQFDSSNIAAFQVSSGVAGDSYSGELFLEDIAP